VADTEDVALARRALVERTAAGSDPEKAGGLTLEGLTPAWEADDTQRSGLKDRIGALGLVQGRNRLLPAIGRSPGLDEGPGFCLGCDRKLETGSRKLDTGCWTLEVPTTDEGRNEGKKVRQLSLLGGLCPVTAPG
jgi:hypothetical protein